MAKLYEFIKINDYQMRNFHTVYYDPGHKDKFYNRFKELMREKNELAELDLDQFGYFLDFVYDNSKPVDKYDEEKYPNANKYLTIIDKENGAQCRYIFLDKFANVHPYGTIMVVNSGFLITIYPLEYTKTLAKLDGDRELLDKTISELKELGTVSGNYTFSKANHVDGILKKMNNSFRTINTRGLISKDTMSKLQSVDCRKIENLQEAIIPYVDTKNEIKNKMLELVRDAKFGYNKKFEKMINDYFEGKPTSTKMSSEEKEIFKKCLSPVGITEITQLDYFFKHNPKTRIIENLNIPKNEIDILYDICKKNYLNV